MKFFWFGRHIYKKMIFNLLSCLTQTYPTINTYEIWFCGCVIAKKRFVTFVICNCTKLPRMSERIHDLILYGILLKRKNVLIYTIVKKTHYNIIQ